MCSSDLFFPDAYGHSHDESDSGRTPGVDAGDMSGQRSNNGRDDETDEGVELFVVAFLVVAYFHNAIFLRVITLLRGACPRFLRF